MYTLENLFYWITIALYVGSSVILLYCNIFKYKNLKLTKILDILVFSSFIAHAITIIIRWIQSGHIPVMGNYENALVGSWIILCLFFILKWKWDKLNNILIVIIPFVILMLGYGLKNNIKSGPLTPPYQSPWLIVHIIFAWFAYASFSVAFALGIYYLIKDKNPEMKDADKKKIDKLAANLINFGFINEAIMIVAGAIWANLLWGSYWNWDPVETWSLIVWLIYGLYIHLRYTYNWKNRKAAWLAVISFILMIISFWGTNIIGDSLHVFNLI